MQTSIAKNINAKAPYKNLILRCDPLLNKALRQIALDRDTSLQAVCIEALKQYAEAVQTA